MAINYKPVTCVWEVTMGCNMRCGHCGSSCAEPLPDELTTGEAISVIDQISEMGLRWVTLSGGEPLTRKDLPILVERLNRKGVVVNIITNGWLMTKEMARKLKDAGISTVAISIDGPKEIHDIVRKEGAFDHAVLAIKNLKSLGITVGTVTTISKLNINKLKELKETLISIGVDSWQVQLGLPMGNFKERPDWVVEPKEVDNIIDFCYETAKEGRIQIFPADCIGYYSHKDLKTKEIAFKSGVYPVWDGCNAGVNSFGLLHNGDILGCTSIRSREFIEGNLKEMSLKDIWYDENTFLWRRAITKKQLKGMCSVCKYGEACLGGCPNTRLTMKGSIYDENEYCSYNVAMKNKVTYLEKESDLENLLFKAESLAVNDKYQESALVLDRILALDKNNIKALRLKGYVEFQCGNYDSSENANKKALGIIPEDPYSLKGLGLSLHMQGDSKNGLTYLQKAAEITNFKDEDIMNDLHIVETSIRR